jgi:hypothetical protein
MQRMGGSHRLPRLLLFAVPLFGSLPLLGCERGCARSWLGSGRAGRPGLGTVSAIDCPDGLARCEAGTVLVSRLATVPFPCNGPPARCQCPWDRLEDCDRVCVADGIELVIDRERARAQLCAPEAGAPEFARPLGPAPGAPAESCDEGQAYVCRGGTIVDCAIRAAVGRCNRGCYAEGASIDDASIGRERGYALLCSR